MENELKNKQIEKLKMKIKSTTCQYKNEILDCKQLIKSQLNDFIKFKETMSKQSIISTKYNECDKKSNNLIEVNPLINNEDIDKLKNKIKILENFRKSIDKTKNKIDSLQNESKLYQNEIKNLKQENKDLTFKLNFDKKCIENRKSLNEMNYEQSQQRYSINTTNHENNMKAMHLFLSQINDRCQSFLDKYCTNTTNKKEEEEEENEDIDIENEISIRNIEPKLKATYANLEQFLVDVSMIILSKETNHLNIQNHVDMDLMLSDVDI